MEILKTNPYSIFLKLLINISQLCDFYIALKSDAGLDQRVYKLLIALEVARICVEQDAESYTLTPHIHVYTDNNKSQLVIITMVVMIHCSIHCCFPMIKMDGIVVFRKLIL
ncbi:hypothetical protein RDI58_000804 [Solanum bulbocastanum]|uniref:Uncharacterized protein n=1 Tax=Solanum bulbocastanum TaxID=147425 RepID=A0AAN8UBC3_SOLBU